MRVLLTPEGIISESSELPTMASLESLNNMEGALISTRHAETEDHAPISLDVFDTRFNKQGRIGIYPQDKCVKVLGLDDELQHVDVTEKNVDKIAADIETLMTTDGIATIPDKRKLMLASVFRKLRSMI